MDLLSLDGLRVWISALLLLVFVSLGKFLESMTKPALIVGKIYVLFFLHTESGKCEVGKLSSWAQLSALEKLFESAQKVDWKMDFWQESWMSVVSFLMIQAPNVPFSEKLSRRQNEENYHISFFRPYLIALEARDKSGFYRFPSDDDDPSKPAWFVMKLRAYQSFSGKV